MAATDRGSAELAAKAKKQLASGTKDPLEKLRLTCLSRGASGIKGLGRQFRIIDDDGSKSLDRREFFKGCTDFGADLSKEEEMEAIFTRIDKDGSGSLDFDEFLVALRPPMSNARRELITKAFQKLDKTRDGVITVEDLKAPSEVSKRRMDRGDVFKDGFVLFSLAFYWTFCRDAVTKEEFFNYYSGVSASIDNDAYFDLMMRTAYKICLHAFLSFGSHRT
uniref:Calcyphosin-like protein n=1 Tax=Macrostomum lignano TaxID=282301 RepID=A0A1I8F3N1_9PLAT